LNYHSEMEIRKLKLDEGAKMAEGLTVIIDVFRAFSLECYLINNGVELIYPVRTVDEAFELKKLNNDIVLIGERHEKICNGFDFGNSPTHINDVDFSGKTVVHTTSSGTKGLALAVNASEIITGSFVNAKAIANYIRRVGPSVVSLVAMGYEGLYGTQEDDLCADYIESLLMGKPFDFAKVISVLKNGDGARMFDPKNQDHSPESDFYFCLDFDRFDFVLKVEYNNANRRIIKKIDVV
jgi:2-phosphosulfolactate phosphatase